MDQTFEVGGMSCAHCEQAVKRALEQVDPTARVDVDLASGHVAVHSAQPRQDLVLAIENAGYRVQ
ncbi:MAG: copper chaperone [Comamonadaceae bacterium]|nr:MAG: copper chaperone [Comamonadaceae bacterium]